jgi:hypothetical protein
MKSSRFFILNVNQWWGLALLLFAVALSGCVSKTKADERARAAFFAGQQQAQASLASHQATHLGPTVTVLGDVKNTQVPWTADLTLAKALIAAEYYGPSDPTQIVIQRDGKEIVWDPKRLLTGQDIQLRPSDVIELAH